MGRLCRIVAMLSMVLAVGHAGAESGDESRAPETTESPAPSSDANATSASPIAPLEAHPPDSPPAEPTVAAVTTEPQQAELLARQGAALFAGGEYLSAVDRLRAALQLDPAQTEARFVLGQSLFNLGDVDGAIEEYKRVLTERPESVPAHFHTATAYMAKRQWKEAQRELQTVLTLNPKHTGAHHNLGTVRYSQGDVKGTIDAYRASLAINPDSAETHYHLGVVLKLSGRLKEAVPELLAASEAGHPKAQYFLGTAYSIGSGVERNLPAAIRWWVAATEHGVPEAQDALSKLRKAAMKPSPGKDSNKTLLAFQAYRDDLWNEFPELTRNGTEETVGVALLQAFRLTDAIPTLVREATALSELSERYLAALYEEGMHPLLKPHDGRILRYFESSANDGSPQSKLALARIHALGLGVAADRGKALAIIKGLPPGYAEQFLQDLATRPAGTSPHTVRQASETPPAAP